MSLGDFRRSIRTGPADLRTHAPWISRIPELRGTQVIGPGLAAKPAPGPDGEDWYANLLWFDRRKCLLLTHAATLFSIFEANVSAPDLRATGPLVSRLIKRELACEGVPSAVFAGLEPQDLILARTADRSVLGCMNDMAFICRYTIALAARYEAIGAFGQALATRQNAFDTGRTLASYRALRDAAGKAGQWEAVRERALQQLRSDAAASAAPSRAGFGWSEGPVWISALIDDGDVGAAWDAAAGVASDRQWLTLADLISSDRPADALPVYLRAIEPLRSRPATRYISRSPACLARSRTAISGWAPRRSSPLT